MKALIWIGCFILHYIFSNIIKPIVYQIPVTDDRAILLRSGLYGILVAISFGCCFALAKVLCKKWDLHKKSKKNAKAETITPEYSRYQALLDESIEETAPEVTQNKPERIEKVSHNVKPTKTVEAKGLLSDTAETEDVVVATNENKDMYGATASIAEPEGSALAEKKPSTITVNPTVNNQKAPTAKRYCRYCGSLVDEETKTCTGCGKQYFKGIKHVLGKIFCKKHLALVIVSFLLLASLIANNVLAVRVADLDRAYHINYDKVKNYEDLIDDYIKEISSLKRDLKFYDTHVVFVSDDGTNLYHKLDCSKYDRSRYWAFNIEAVQSKGYKACSSCCD